jgi:hypothetical protein
VLSTREIAPAYIPANSRFGIGSLQRGQSLISISISFRLVGVHQDIGLEYLCKDITGFFT